MDKIDRDRQIASRVSLFVSLFVFFVKFYGYRVTNSQAILSDALESIVNVIAACVALVTVVIASKPADKSHPYGHGKAEFFSAAFEGGLIAFAGFLIAVESIGAFLGGLEVRQIDLGLTVVAFAGLTNLALGFYLSRVGKRTQSTALIASGNHVLADFWTSFGVFVGLGLVWMTRLNWLDQVIALTVGLHLSWNGYRVVRRSLSGLMDEEDQPLLKELVETFNKEAFPGIIRIHHTRAIRSGSHHHIDAHVVVPEFWNVEKAHFETERFEQAVLKSVQWGGELAFHLDPCRKAYCQSCELSSCSIRVKEFVEKAQFTLEELTSPTELELYESDIDKVR